MPNILFVGDIAVLSKTEGYHIDEKLKTMFSQYELRVCNIEGPISNESLSKSKKAGPSLQQDESVIKVLSELGFTLFCLANNHIMDYGEQGLKETIKNLSYISGSACIGAGLSVDDTYLGIVKNFDGIKIGFINAAENSFGVNFELEKESSGHAWLFSEKFKKLIKDTRDKCDKLVLISHAGLENLDIPMPEWRRVYREFVDIGVDVIIAHHPHVIQGWEKYNNGLIFYSLGNFLWEKKGGVVKKYRTIAIGIKIEEGRVDYEIIPIVVDKSRIIYCEEDDYRDYLYGLCNQLEKKNEEDFIEKVDSFALNQYEKEFPSYLCYASGNIKVYSLKTWIKQLIYSCLCKQKIDDVFVFHNTAVETNNWVCQRAIKSKQSTIRKN